MKYQLLPPPVRWAATGFLFLGLLSAEVAAADKAAALPTLGRLPVKEITVFKDGHAFVAQEGTLATDPAGNVVLDQLPTPVVGTFWPYSADPKARLKGVVASQRRVLIQRTALTLREILQANVGASAWITESATNQYLATIVGLPRRSAEELAATSPPNSGDRLPESGNLILLQTPAGTKVVNLDRIQDVTIQQFQPTTAVEEFRNLLTLKMDWGGSSAATNAQVGLLYLQKGVRWIPSYKVSLDGTGQALITLEATLINEMMDLEDVSVNLVVGVPTFTFKDTIDPLALQQTAAQLSQFFQNDPSGNLRNGALAGNFNNAIMSQSARMNEYRPPAELSPGSGPELGETTRSEDLFVFNAGHLSLKKGERMVLQLAEFSLPYTDVFALELPFAPPMEMRQNGNSQQQQELARLLNAPKVMHKIRLTNKSSYPLTTAPALIMRSGRVISQGLMTYASPGATSDLTLTTAVEVSAKRTDIETSRNHNVLNRNGSSFSRVDLSGQVTLTNYRSQPAVLEVTRYVLGNVESSDHEGKAEKLNSLEDAEMAQPAWNNWYGWPSWWSNVNGLGKVTWKLTLAPGQCAELGYKWNYFWP